MLFNIFKALVFFFFVVFVLGIFKYCRAFKGFWFFYGFRVFLGFYFLAFHGRLGFYVKRFMFWGARGSPSIA